MRSDSLNTRNELLGIMWMVLTGLLFVGVNGVVRALGDDLPATESAFIRFVIGLVFLSPILIRGFRNGLPPGLMRPFLLRGALHCGAVILWFYAMARISVAEVTAIGFLNPIVVTIGAALLLGERLSWRRAAAIGVALLGAMVVLRPGMRDLQDGHFAQMGAALLFGSSYLVAKTLSERAPPALVVAMLSLTVTIGLAPLAIAVWVPPTPTQLGGLALVALFATAGHYTMTRAFALAPMTVTQPVVFLQLIWASLLGVMVFHEPFDPFVLLGGAMMIAAITYITWRDARARRATIPPAPATKD